MKFDQSTVSLLLTFLVGVVLPGVASFLSRQHWPSTLTAFITVLLAAITGLVNQWITNPDAYSLSQAGLTAAFAYVAAAVARSQFWRGTKLDAKLLAFPRKLPPGGEQPGAEPEGMAA